MEQQYKVVNSLYASTYKEVSESGKGLSKNNTILMGSFVTLLDEVKDKWQKVSAFGIEGWIEKAKLGDNCGFKCFYVDVGQGDGALLEIGNGPNVVRILIDGGPSDNLARYLNKWQYRYYLNQGKTVHFDYVFISHFDKDHYNGLIEIINDPHYTFGTIFHNGIAKFDKKKPSPGYDTTLGNKIKNGNKEYLTTHFNSLADLNKLQQSGGIQNLMEKFLYAVNNAYSQGRLKDFKRIDHNDRNSIPSNNINGRDFAIEVLGPVTNQFETGLAYEYFDDDSHTVNGHSLVLKLSYGTRSFLFGGDLNIPAEKHLMNHYNVSNPFEVDIAKSCHHGASEFEPEFMAKINALATVISSGDNESYAHPRADAIGCAGKYSRSKRPLVFSTELARSTNVETDEIRYGMINLRCDGDKIVMAQMKEVISDGKVWDLYDDNELNP